MAFRIVDKDRWDKTWFNRLPPGDKLAWDYLNDKCDEAGVWECNFAVAIMHIFGEERMSETDRGIYTIDWRAFLERCAGRIEELGKSKWWIVDHIGQQKRTFLSAKVTNRPHQAVIACLRTHGLLRRYEAVEMRMWGFSEFMASVNLTELSMDVIALEESKAKQRDFELQMQVETSVPPSVTRAREVLEYLNRAALRKFESPQHLKLIVAAMRIVGQDVAGCKKMIDRMVAQWKGTKFEEYLQPSTLFGTNKFVQYYEKRDLPVRQAGDASKPMINAVTEKQHEEGF